MLEGKESRTSREQSEGEGYQSRKERMNRVEDD